MDTWEHQPCAVLVTDGRGVVLQLNAAAAALLGGERAQWPGRLLDAALPPAGRVFLQTHLWPTLLREGSIREAFVKLAHGQGEPVPVLINASRLGVDPPRYCWALMATHERSRFEAALLAARTRAEAVAKELAVAQHLTRSVADAAPSVIAYYDAELRCQFANEAHQEWFGRTPDQMLGVTMLELLGEAAFTRSEHFFRAALAGRRQQYERQVVKPNGVTEFMLFSYVPDVVDGDVQGFVVQGTNVSSLKATQGALQRSAEALRRTGRLAAVGGWELDVQAGKLKWSEELRALLAAPSGYLATPATALDVYAPHSRLAVEGAVSDAVRTGASFDLEVDVIRFDGVLRHVRVVGSTESHEGRVRRLVGAVQDITAQRQVAAELAQQHELLRVTLHSIGDAVITTNASACVTWLNPAAERMTGWLCAEAEGQPLAQVFQIINEQTRAAAESPVQACLDQRRVVGLASDTILISRAGIEYGVEDSAAPILDGKGDLLGAVLVFHDVTEQRRLSGEMTHRAKHDSLTGLVNRVEFEARLRHCLDRSLQEHSGHALMFIDLDHFKLVNDACGHSAGDQLLKQISRLMNDAVRARDTLARLGGDEFAVLLEHCTVEQAQRVAEKICAQMADFRFIHDGKRFRVGASIGLVPVDDRWTSLATLMQAADTACYAAKEEGRNRVHTWFDSEQSLRERQGETQWATRLEQALDDDQFELFAQRIHRADGAEQGVYAEVLLRLRDADGSLVPPGAFLPAAERFHLATRIDRWVLGRVIRTLREPGSVESVNTLCVNLSGQSVGDRAFHRYLLDTLAGLPPALRERLCLEITETAAITNLAAAAAFIEQVRALQVRVALEDFGAGASSFGYLKHLPVDVLKIDGQFIQALVDNRLNEAAVRCFVEVAGVVGVPTVAEFVDRPEVLARVRELGVNLVQGYLLHRPEPLGALLLSAQAPAIC